MKIYCMSCGEGIDYSIKEPESCPFCKNQLKQAPVVSKKAPEASSPSKKELKKSDLENFLKNGKKKKAKEVEEEDEEDLEDDDESEEDDEDDFDEDEEDDDDEEESRATRKSSRRKIDPKDNPFEDSVDLSFMGVRREKIGSIAVEKAEVLPPRKAGKKLTKAQIIKDFRNGTGAFQKPTEK